MNKKELIEFAIMVAEEKKAEARNKNEKVKTQRRVASKKRSIFSQAEVSLGLHLSHLDCE